MNICAKLYALGCRIAPTVMIVVSTNQDAFLPSE